MNEFAGVHGIPSIPNIGHVLGQTALQVKKERKVVNDDPLLNNVAVNYYGDHGGCGWWRLQMPEMMINYSKSGNIMGMTKLIPNEEFYSDVKTVRLQRQASREHLDFLTHLKGIATSNDIKLIYEIDDVILKHDIPDFNIAKDAYMDDGVFESTVEMMKMCDVMTVSCDYLKEYFEDKIGHKNVQVFQNMPSKMWFDGYYNKTQIMTNFDKQKKRPRILYAGSGNHFNIKRTKGIKDDFSHVIDSIIKTRKQFEWVFIGAHPYELTPFIKSGEMKLFNWVSIYDYPRILNSLNMNAVIAPLMDCPFNRGKSNIKYLEASCLGIPGAFQDIVTYKDAPLRFSSGDDMIDQLKKLLSDHKYYAKMSKRARDYANTMWLDDHINDYKKLYF